MHVLLKRHGWTILHFDVFFFFDFLNSHVGFTFDVICILIFDFDFRSFYIYHMYINLTMILWDLLNGQYSSHGRLEYYQPTMRKDTGRGLKIT